MIILRLFIDRQMRSKLGTATGRHEVCGVAAAAAAAAGGTIIRWIRGLKHRM